MASQASNIHDFTHCLIEREYRETSTFVYPVKEQVLPKGKENVNSPEENYLMMP